MKLTEFFQLCKNAAKKETMNEENIICSFQVSSINEKYECWCCFYCKEGNFSGTHESPETAISIALENRRLKVNPKETQLTL